jgi:hypothetical protein
MSLTPTFALRGNMVLKPNSALQLKKGFLLVVREVKPHEYIDFIQVCNCEVYATSSKKQFLGFSTFWFDTDTDFNGEWKSITRKDDNLPIDIFEIKRILL